MYIENIEVCQEDHEDLQQIPPRIQNPELKKDGQTNPFVDKGSIALLAGCFGGFLTVLGAVMTSLAFTLEKGSGFQSVASTFGCRTDVAGPVLLVFGGIVVSWCLGMVYGGVCLNPIKQKQSKLSNRHIEGIQYYCSNDETRF